MAQMDFFFDIMVDTGASDLHICSGAVPMLRLNGEMVPIKHPVMEPRDAYDLIHEIMPIKYRKEFAETHDVDFAYDLKDSARFRANIFMDRKGISAVFRQIPPTIFSLEKLGLPPIVKELCELENGFIVVTGPTGSGKSTTLASMIEYINKTRKVHIITIEDPIEYVHQNRLALINQREVGVHTRNFRAALRAALREDPDIVLVGEMRDLETIEIALETAETGHLVLATLHTSTATGTIDRIIDSFPKGQQQQIRTMLSSTLKAVIAQNLLKRADGTGLIAAFETLMVTTGVANTIREGKIHQIETLMQAGKKHGMQTMQETLIELVKKRLVTSDDAFRKAPDKTNFLRNLSYSGYVVNLTEKEKAKYRS